MTVVRAPDRGVLLLGLFAALSAFIVGILIGVFGVSQPGEPLSKPDRFQDKEFVSSVLEQVDQESLREFLKELSSEPHIAAGRRDKELVRWMKAEWEAAGIETVTLDSYDILLSYPNSSQPNKVHLLDGEGKVTFSSRHKEEVLRAEDEDPEFIHAFNAYTPPGDVTGDLVYVNYGRVEDIQKLDELGISLKGRIAISRYGKIYRGNRLQNCEKAGAIGVIMFSDPEDVASRGVNASQVYPNSFFLPESGIQRGSTIVTPGDAMSPGWPSLEGAYRLSEEEALKHLPKIPSQPIGYGDARKLLEVMGGPEVPEDWRGGLPGLTYRLGPGTNKESHPGWKARIVTHNYLKDVVDTNVIGVIRGSEEPDRYVLLSNHRDAWGYGAIDPSSGTTALMETARVLGNLHKTTGWRPRRTIVFASWAAEEYYLMGSIEWVHHHIQKIMERAVALINVDICIIGDILSPKASPILKDVFVEAIKAVPSTFDPSQSYYEFLEGWLASGEKTKDTSVEEYVKILGSGSDHHEFAFYAGVPGLYFAFRTDEQKYPKAGYPAYHTGFETFYLMDKILDPGFALHKSCSQLGMHMMLQLAESALLPLATRHFVAEVEKGLAGLEKVGAVKQLRDAGLGKPFDVLVEAIEEFSAASSLWTERRQEMQKSGELDDPMKARMLNDQIMKFERVWILPKGLPGREAIRHAVFSPAKFNAYGGAAFPGISDLLHEFDKLEEEERAERLLELRKHLSDLMILFRQAASWLQPFDLI